MAHFSKEMPRPEPNMDDAGFWQGCADRSLVFQACGQCGTLRHPPVPMCPTCHSTSVKWIKAPQHGEIFTFTVVSHASHEAVTPQLPYVVAVVQFPALPGVRLVTNITDIASGDVRIGMPVQLWWDDIGDGMHLPRFKPVADGGIEHG